MPIPASALPAMWDDIAFRVRDRGAPAAAEAMADGFAREVRQRLSRVGHFLHTETPAPPGGPPAWISLRLRDSVGSGPWGTVRRDSAAAEAHADTPYAAIQEFGGTMRAHSDRGMRWQEPPGRWHRSMQHDLPERSYFRTTLVLVEPELPRWAGDGFESAGVFAGLG